MRRWQNAWWAPVLVVATMFGGNLPLAAQGTEPTQEARAVAGTKCWADWSDAAVIVRRETLMPIERANKFARDKHPGAEVIKVTLCEEQGKFVYRLLLRERQGQLKTELLDARQAIAQ
jgi:uncharacterized membrane protein YkoI